MTANGIFSYRQQQFNYWSQLGIVNGRETLSTEGEENATIRISGWAYDLGMTWLTSLPGKPELTVALAATSGDSDQSDDRDTAYRQTGIQSNTADIGSLTSVPYYGFAVSPELSNLQVATVAIGYPIKSNSYLYLKHHRYRHRALSGALRNFSVDLDLTENSKDLGHSTDLTFNYEDSKHWATSFSIGSFTPGAAVQTPHKPLHYSLLSFSYTF